MANNLYAGGKERILGHSTESINLINDNIKAILIDTGTYTVNLSSHVYHSSLSGIVATSGNLTGKSTTGGVFDAADVTFTSVTGNSVEAIVLYKDTGTSSTSPLIAYIDTVASGLPITPSGINIVVAWDNGADKIFVL